MKIAVIGGGGAGMTTAYLLDSAAHAVTVYEKKPILGGNIRTLGKNVTGVDLPTGVVLDNGVIEFPLNKNPYFARLMTDLNVKLERIPAGTQMFAADGNLFAVPSRLFQSNQSLFDKLTGFARMIPVGLDYYRLRQMATPSNHPRYKGQPTSAVLDDRAMSRWFAMLLTYSYSIPYPKVPNMPAELAAAVIYMAAMDAQWVRVVGGVYTYIEKILDRFSGNVCTDAHITGILRTDTGVKITLENSPTTDFDAVVFATPPHAILTMLSDPTDDERTWFSEWQANTATTIIHTDTRFYERYRTTVYSEFDVVERNNGDAGYHAYLNRLCGIPDQPGTDYILSFNMDDVIAPETMIHQQHHETPLYDYRPYRYREAIQANNGRNRTYHAGAYLGNGLHEGAIESAYRVVDLLEQ
jgi:predicted NAD/FAD-binding protein